MTKPYIIFSDLDGTLLDYHTYSFESAQPALNKIKEEEIPLVLVSSKTRREMVYYQEALGLIDLPFVVENGSAIFTSPGYFSDLKHCEVSGYYDRYALGKTYNEIESILKTISEKHDYLIRGFHNASQKEVKEMTGLSEDQLQMALSREFSIPLFFDDQAEQILENEIENFGLKVLYGGRFMHLLSNVDKGEALKIIMKGFCGRESRNDLQSIAIGDSLNDFAMLAAADHSILVKKHDGSYERRQTLENVKYSPGIGPEGWNHSLTTFLETGGNNE
jgi:mannosyl-3-phosphoglycerate phosphatase